MSLPIKISDLPPLLDEQIAGRFVVPVSVVTSLGVAVGNAKVTLEQLGLGVKLPFSNIILGTSVPDGKTLISENGVLVLTDAVTSSQITEWNTAFGWGDHALAGYALTTDLTNKQDILVSGTNIKTINGESILGSGNIVITGGGGGATSLNELSDVTIGTSAAGQTIVFNGTVYANGFVDYSTIINKPSVFVPAAHTHIISDVTGLQTALDGKQTADDDLTAIAALSGLAGLLRKTGDGVWTLDTNTYLTTFSETDPVFLASAASGITSTQISNWDTAFGWGNHASVGYLTQAAADLEYAQIVHTHTISDVTGLQTALDSKQPIDGDLTAIAALGGSTGLLRKTAADTWTLDTSGYALDSDVVKLTGNQTIDGTKTFSSTISGSINGNANTATTLTSTRTIWGQNFNGSANVTGALSGVTTLSMSSQLTNTIATGTAPFVITSTTRVNNLNVATAGTADIWTTARTITIGATGKSVNGSANVAWSLSEIGAQPVDADLTAIAALAGTSGLLRKTAADTWTLDTNVYALDSDVVKLTGDQTIAGTKTFSSTISGSINGNASTATSLATGRTITIGTTGKTFNGTADVSWSLGEIGAAAASHTHVINDVTGLQTALDGKQSTLVSGTNIKTVNGNSILGAGDLTISGGFTLFEESFSNAAPNATIPAHQIAITTAAANADFVITPKGANGALLAQIPDNTATGGNKRGNGAVDFQRVRSVGLQIASGLRSFIGNGSNNTVSGSEGFCGSGNNNTVSGTAAVCPGGQSNLVDGSAAWVPGGAGGDVKGVAAACAWSGGFRSLRGDNQHFGVTVQQSTVNVQTRTLTSTRGSVPSSTNTFNIVQGMWSGIVTVHARERAAANVASYIYHVVAVQDTGGIVVKRAELLDSYVDAGLSGIACNIVANNTLSTLTIVVDGIDTKTIDWFGEFSGAYIRS